MRNTSILLLALAAFSGNAFACDSCKTTATKQATACSEDCPEAVALAAAKKELVEAKKAGDKAAIEAAQKKVETAKAACDAAHKKHTDAK
jgi:hypothetical protein